MKRLLAILILQSSLFTLHIHAQALPDTLVTAWKGERVGVQLHARCETETAVRLAVHPLSHKASQWQTISQFIDSVLTDEFNTCGEHPLTLKPYRVPDVLNPSSYKLFQPNASYPLWFTFEVPHDAKPGDYKWEIQLINAYNHRVFQKQKVTIRVIDRALPTPKEQALHIDYWQQPYAVSRYHGVERWSEEHFRLLRPYLQLLARAGQSVITTILFYEPWGRQSNDKFDPMIRTTHHADGTWSYDYTIFDRYVQLCDSCGIGPQINCYSMVPWDMTFRYYDEAKGQDINLKTTTSAPEYAQLWIPFLRAFAQHLRQRGWLNRTCIAMDERPLSAMLDAWRICQQADPELRMALAGNHHPELAPLLQDYSIAYGQHFTPEELVKRQSEGKSSTVYTCCSERRPNTFTNSQPVEALYLPLYAVANHFDGLLHWSWMNWTDYPLYDSRFFLFGPGDTYLIYPGPRSSIRWEGLIQGIQLAEKVIRLRTELASDHPQRQALEQALAPFKREDPGSTEQLTNNLRHLIEVVNQN